MANDHTLPPPTAPKIREKSQSFTIKSQTAMVNTYSWECCLNCDHWDEVKEGCKQFADDKGEPIKVPAKVIVVGCEAYNPNIPF